MKFKEATEQFCSCSVKTGVWIQKTTKTGRTSSDQNSALVRQQASVLTCKHILDTLLQEKSKLLPLKVF